MLFGWVATYKGREYRRVRHDPDWAELVSNDPKDLDWGFTVYAPGVFVKQVPRSEIAEIYFRSTYAQVQGHKVALLRSEGGRFLGSADDYIPGFVEIERGGYQGWLEPHQIERMWEERTHRE